MYHLFVRNNVGTIEYRSTVVPALGDPRRERPPAVSGHFVLAMSRHMSTLNDL